jgi:transcription termination factor NusA
MTDITQITGIGPAAAGLLVASGFKTVEDIASASVEALGGVKGFGPARAEKIIAAAKELLAAPTAAEPAPAKPAKPAKAEPKADPAKEKKKPKDKDKEKDKKKKDKKGKKKKK